MISRVLNYYGPVACGYAEITACLLVVTFQTTEHISSRTFFSFDSSVLLLVSSKHLISNLSIMHTAY
jgi:hypothetical protein